MKIFAVILSFIVLFLSANPCIDVVKDNTTQKIELPQSADSNHASDSDHCSPFCTCHCCQTTVYVSEIITLNPSNAIAISYIEHNSSFRDLYQFDLLIPPKA